MKLIQGSFAKRAVMVGLIAGSSILAASAFAVSAAGPESNVGCEAMHGQNGHGKWEERRAEHLSALKEKLKLKPGQEAAWNTFAKASQSGVRSDADRQTQRSEFAKLNTPQRLDKMLAMSDMRRTKMVERTQVVKAFYAQLTPEQQSVFDAEGMSGHHMGQYHHQS
ncbi:MAG: Spy/CpxP family protein refolding chaperone [Sulfuriferula sp.]